MAEYSTAYVDAFDYNQSTFEDAPEPTRLATAEIVSVCEAFIAVAKPGPTACAAHVLPCLQMLRCPPQMVLRRKHMIAHSFSHSAGHSRWK